MNCGNYNNNNITNENNNAPLCRAIALLNRNLTELIDLLKDKKIRERVKNF